MQSYQQSLRYSDCVFLVLSGDIAASGSDAEYQQAESLFTQIQDTLSTYNKKVPFHFVIVPGNHDCCYGTEQNVRNAVIANAKDFIRDKRTVTPDMLVSCTAIQDRPLF
jgi:hypothetical protein